MKESLDIHCHFFPIKVFKKLSKKYNSFKFYLRNFNHETLVKISNVIYKGNLKKGFSDETALIEETRKSNLRRIISIAPLTLFYEIEPNECLEFAKEFNDYVSLLQEKNREIVKFMAYVPLQDPIASSEELERAYEELNLHGVEIGSNINGKNLDDENLEVFFKKASLLNIPIFIHPINVLSKLRLRKYYFVNSLGNPIETTIAASSLIFGGLFEKFPNLKVILAHGGGFLPYQIGRLEHAYNVRKEPKVNNIKNPKYYLKKNIYFDTIVHDSKALKFLIEQVGEGKVLLGSDYPFDMGYEDPTLILKDMYFMNQEEILYKNAIKLFKIKDW